MGSSRLRALTHHTHRIETFLSVLLATVAAAWAVYAMWVHAILHWYADAWVVYPTLVDAPWWQELTREHNGHRMISSQLLRWIDLHAFRGNQQVLRVAGVASVVATFFVITRATHRAGDSPRWLRAQILLVLVLGIAWLGNARMLGHPYEAAHVYLVMWCAMLAAAVLARSASGALTMGERVRLGLYVALPAFVFGSGLALLPAALVVLILIHARRADCAAVTLGGLATVVLYFTLPGADGTSETLRVAPLTQIDLLVRWLAAPVVYVGLPLVDPDIASTIPVAAVAAVVRPVAETWLRQFGDVWHVAALQRLIGMVGVAWLLQASLAARAGRRPQLAIFCLLVAWFGLAAGALVALSRTDYFAVKPLQLHATRYLPWSCLFWSGLVATSLAQYAASLRPARVTAAVAALAIVLLASNVGGYMWSGQMMKVAAEQSAAAREGRDPVDWFETDPAAFHAALEPARRRGVGPWAGP